MLGLRAPAGRDGIAGRNGLTESTLSRPHVPSRPAEARRLACRRHGRCLTARRPPFALSSLACHCAMTATATMITTRTAVAATAKSHMRLLDSFSSSFAGVVSCRSGALSDGVNHAPLLVDDDRELDEQVQDLVRQALHFPDSLVPLDGHAVRVHDSLGLLALAHRERVPRQRTRALLDPPRRPLAADVAARDLVPALRVIDEPLPDANRCPPRPIRANASYGRRKWLFHTQISGAFASSGLTPFSPPRMAPRYAPIRPGICRSFSSRGKAAPCQNRPHSAACRP